MNSPDDREPHDDLESELRALGEALDLPTPPPTQTAQAVRARLESPDGRESPERPARRERPGLRLLGRPRWQWVTTVIVLALAVFLGGTPQGRAAVAHILRYAGIEVRVGEPVPTLSGAPGPLPGERRVSLEEARGAVRFTVGVPAALGDPSEVRVSDGGRVVSLLWPGVRLDEYDGTLDVVFRKELGEPFPQDTAVGNAHGWWIPAKHGLTYIPRDGGRPLTYTRLAAPTLIWQRGGTGLRLEGIADRARAIAVAASTR
jgi:hypothetical protein